MDIATHAGIGLIAASPVFGSRPALALGIIAGSVLPDLDALLRIWGKRAFLRGHQKWSHALPVHVAFSVGCGILAWFLGANGFEAGFGLLAGLTGHSLLDLTNTFGVSWLVPFSGRRICLSWVFFIDAVVIVATAAVLCRVIPKLLRGEDVSVAYAVAFLMFLVGYIIAKGLLKSRARHFCPEASSLSPSALVPWHFFGTVREKDVLRSFRMNALTGQREALGEVPLFDDSFAELMAELPEYQVMRELSSEYHIVEAKREGSETHLLCRDMRIRNFGTRFGDLEVWLDANKQIVRTRFHA